MNLFFRALYPADAALATGAEVDLAPGLDWVEDPAAATGGFATEQLLVLVVPDDGSSALRSARVVGERRMLHHLASAVDVEVVVVALAAPGLSADEAAQGFSQAMMRTSLALAGSGSGGREVPPSCAGSVQA